MPGVEVAPEVIPPPTEFGVVGTPADVEFPLVGPLDWRFPPTEFGFVVKPVDVELGVITIVLSDGVITVAPLGNPTDGGRIGTGEMEPGVSAGGVGVTGGIAVIAGAATRGPTISLLSKQSGPLRSMQAGTASGTLSLRSLGSAAMTGVIAVKNTINDRPIRFIVVSFKVG